MPAEDDIVNRVRKYVKTTKMSQHIVGPIQACNVNVIKSIYYLRKIIRKVANHEQI